MANKTEKYSNNVMHYLSLIGLLIMTSLLASCDSLRSADNSRETIEGDRISVLTFEQQLSADPALANL